MPEKNPRRTFRQTFPRRFPAMRPPVPEDLTPDPCCMRPPQRGPSLPSLPAEPSKQRAAQNLLPRACRPLDLLVDLRLLPLDTLLLRQLAYLLLHLLVCLLLCLVLRLLLHRLAYRLPCPPLILPLSAPLSPSLSLTRYPLVHLPLPAHRHLQPCQTRHVLLCLLPHPSNPPGRSGPPCRTNLAVKATAGAAKRC